MKKLFIITLVLLISLLSCQKVANIVGIDIGNNDYKYPDESMFKKTFKTIVLSSSGAQINKTYQFYRVAEYDKLEIYVEKNSQYKQSNVDYIANEFNTHYNEEVRIYGDHTDVDRNGKIIILLFEINSSYESAVTAGYFYGNDLILGKNNNAEILYMDIKLVNEDPEYMAGTILHEFQHLINFNVNYLSNNREISTWLNEALSESTSLLFSPTTVDSRINEFNNYTIGYYCFYTWDLPLNVFANYPSVSVFMNWLYKKNNNDPSVFQNIAKYSLVDDYLRVLHNVSSFTGAATWEDLLLSWIEGVKNNEISGAELKLQPAGSTIQLYPGAAVAYSGSLSSSGNMVIKDFGDGIQVALNKDTYIGNNPTYIGVTIPKSGINTSKTYKTADRKPYIPKYRHILFDKDGNIKKY